MDAAAGGPAGIRPDDDLVSLFRRVAKASPDRVAVADRDASHTFAQLDQGSDTVADCLRQRGIERGQRIGLVAHRSGMSVFGLLGILKAGCAYVPLDPAIPPKRRSHIVDECSISLILDPLLAPGEWWHEQDTGRARAGKAGDSVNGGRRGPAELPGSEAAYVIYTSGSTGLPKGCVVSHRNVVALLRNTLPLFPVSDSDVWTVLHSLTFDFSVWELWGALALGGKAVMVDDATVIDPAALGDLLGEQAVTVLNIVPSAFATLIAPGQRRPATVRTIIMGGGSVQFGVIRRFLDTGDWPSDDGPDVVNMYGITETTVFSTIQRLDPGILENPACRSPIGEPLPHVDLKLFARPGAEATAGEVGEIYIGGVSVSAGYVARPALTAERFVTLAGSDGRAVRYYRTGDLACRTEHGLEYCGRIDHQVKLKGFRIELQEVEGALAALPYIDMAAVTLETSRRGIPVLVAFVVPAALDDVRDLQASARRDLRQILPQYMIPSHIIRRDALPVTSSGKRDREFLSALWRDRRGPTAGAPARG